jgi:hypothetical protein
VVSEAAHHGALDLASFRIRRLIGSGNRNGRYLAVVLNPNPHQSSPRFMLASPTEIACSTGSMTLRPMATRNRFAPPRRAKQSFEGGAGRDSLAEHQY